MANLKKLLAAAQQYLEQDEQILSFVLGAYETKMMGKDTVRNGAFIATDRRLIFYGKKAFGFNMEVFPYENISSIDMGKGLLGHSATFYSSGNKVAMKWINSPDFPKFIGTIKARIGKKATAPAVVPVAATTKDWAEQLKKLAELRDAGILTEDEFQTKKDSILSSV